MVSVIMPAYNAENFISDAIQSVLSQTYADFELIIVDDGSTDSTVDRIKEFTDDRIIFLKNCSNKGIAYTTNRAIEKAKGKYLALMDDDDLSEPNRFELQVGFLESYSCVDVLGGRTTLINEFGDIIERCGTPRNNPRYIYAMLLFQCMDFMNSTVMYRKDFVDKYNIRYRDDYLGMQDYMFYVECSKVGNISSLDEFLLRHRVHSNNESLRQMKMNKNQRADLYARIREYSLGKSGFQLTDNEYRILNGIYTEQGFERCSMSEWLSFKRVLSSIVTQGRNMNVVYLKELKHFCKRKLCDALKSADVFDDDCFVSVMEET